MTFTQRKIELEFALGNNATFNPSGDNTVVLSDHRVHVSVTKTTGTATGEARIRIYGLAPSLLNKLASLNSATAGGQSNRVTVKAGDDVEGMAIVFAGQIKLAQADMSEQPTTALNIFATGAGLQQIQRAPVHSYPGSADAAVILQNLAHVGGLQFLNSGGASKILSTPYFWGDVEKQINDCVRAAGFEKVIDDGVLVIWPKGQDRGGTVPLISPETGLVGYPSYSSWEEGGGISVTTIFNPGLRIGQAVQVKSSLLVANGKWGVFYLSHELEAMVPGGHWFTHFAGQARG